MAFQMPENVQREAVAGVKQLLDSLMQMYPSMGPSIFESTDVRVGLTLFEMFAGYGVTDDDLKELLEPVYNAKKCDEMVVLRGFRGFSLCPHHLLPIEVVCTVGYIPKENRVVGLSKLARVVDVFLKRPDLQETMTDNIAGVLMKHLQPLGCGVIIEGRHMCVAMKAPETRAPHLRSISTLKGVDEISAVTITSALRGAFRENDITRAEFLALPRPGLTI